MPRSVNVLIWPTGASSTKRCQSRGARLASQPSVAFTGALSALSRLSLAFARLSINNAAGDATLQLYLPYRPGRVVLYYVP